MGELPDWSVLLLGRCCDVLEDVGIDNGFDDLDDVDALVDGAVAGSKSKIANALSKCSSSYNREKK